MKYKLNSFTSKIVLSVIIYSIIFVSVFTFARPGLLMQLNTQLTFAESVKVKGANDGKGTVVGYLNSVESNYAKINVKKTKSLFPDVKILSFNVVTTDPVSFMISNMSSEEYYYYIELQSYEPFMETDATAILKNY